MSRHLFLVFAIASTLCNVIGIQPQYKEPFSKLFVFKLFSIPLPHFPKLNNPVLSAEPTEPP